MKKLTKDKIKEAIVDLEKIGGTKDLEIKKVVDKLKKAINDDDNSKK